MLSTYEQFIKRPKDNSLSDAEWKNKIDTSLEKTLTFLKKPQETLAAFATVERQLKEVDQACRPDQLDQGKDIHKNIQELKSQLQVLMQAPGKYMTPDQCRVKVYGANVQQAKAESDFNSLQDKINRALDSIPSWLRQDVTKELGALGSYTRAKDFAGALAALPAIQAKTVQLVKSFSADTELIAIAKELGSVKQNIEKCLAENTKVRETYKPSGLSDVDELKKITPQMGFTIKVYASIWTSLKQCTGRVDELANFCRTTALKAKADRLKEAIQNLEKLGNPFRLPSGQPKSVDEVLRGLIAVRGDQKVVDQANLEASQDQKALANPKRIADILAESKQKMQQMKSVDRKQLQTKLGQSITTVVGQAKTRDDKIKAISKTAATTLQSMVKPEDSQTFEGMDLMLLVATNELDNMLKKCLPSGEFQKDPNLLRELSQAVRQQWAATTTNRVTTDRQGKEHAQIGNTDYVLDSEIGRGGLGIAKLFSDPKDATNKVVLKETKMPTVQNVPADIQYIVLMELNRQMAAELRAQLQVSTAKSPNTLNLKSLCIGQDGRVRAVMDFVDGGDMRKLQKQMDALDDLNLLPQSAKTAIERYLASQTLTGVAAMHGAGIVHHDLKGANIFLTKGMEVKVADFGSGLAMNQQGKTESTKEMVATTRDFYPREDPQRPHDEAFDIYSVGKILEKQLGVGQSPNSGATSGDRARVALTKDEPEARANLEAAAKTAYISQVKEFSETAEFKKLIGALMEPKSKAIATFIKAKDNLWDLLDGARFERLTHTQSILTHLGFPDAVTDGFLKRIEKLAESSNALIEGPQGEVNSIEIKQFAGGANKARETAKSLVAQLQVSQKKVVARIPQLKKEVAAILNDYNQAILKADWGPIQKLLTEPLPDNETQRFFSEKRQEEVLFSLKTAAMLTEAGDSSLDEIGPAYQALINAITALPQEIEGGLQAVLLAGREFMHRTV